MERFFRLNSVVIGKLQVFIGLIFAYFKLHRHLPAILENYQFMSSLNCLLPAFNLYYYLKSQIQQCKPTTKIYKLKYRWPLGY